MKGTRFVLFCLITFIVAVMVPAFAAIPGMNVTGTDGQPMKSETFIFNVVGQEGPNIARMEPLEVTTDDKGFLKFPDFSAKVNGNIYFIKIAVKKTPAVIAIIKIDAKTLYYKNEPVGIKMGDGRREAKEFEALWKKAKVRN